MGALGFIDAHGNDDFVKQSQGTLHDIGMAQGERVETAGEKSCSGFHYSF